jgi:hypothetical protein
MLRGVVRRWCLALLCLCSLGSIVRASQTRSSETPSRPVDSRPRTEAPPRGETAAGEWPRVEIADAYTRDAARRALAGASQWLASPTCQALLSEFQDGNGLTLKEKLGRLEASIHSYLRMVFFLDGERHARCRQHGVLAFTEPDSRVVYLCGRDFERAWRRDPREAQATIIHELLHSLGLGENPPSPRHITDRVRRQCWQ